jgi:DNA-binding transcriptional regulator YhcF (GntR family)
MAHDRVDGATIAMTHEALALMLAVRRAGVTQAVQALTKQGLMESVRGTITVLDRKGLERRAGDSYGVPEREYQRLFGNLHEARVNAKARPWRDAQSAKFNNADA